jgi:general secretion pathway protein H
MQQTSRDGISQHGFTLLELLVVLTIVSFLLLVVAPRFSAVLPGVEFKRETSRFAATLRLARSRAIETQSRSVVVLDARDRTYEIEGSGIGGGFAKKSEFLEYGRSIGNSRDPIRRITFFSNGTASETALIIRQENKEYRVQVRWLTGVVSIGHAS